MIQILTDLFNTCLHHQQVPKAWKNALVVLIHKKGNTSDIKNYRPISLLPIMYKVFSNILRATWRGDMTIDAQSESQNGYPVEIKDLEADQEQDGAMI